MKGGGNRGDRPSYTRRHGEPLARPSPVTQDAYVTGAERRLSGLLHRTVQTTTNGPWVPPMCALPHDARATREARLSRDGRAAGHLFDLFYVF